MAYLAAAVALVGVLCVLDLLLTIGVIRRLKDHTRLLDANSRPPLRPRPGDVVGEFAATDTQGRALSRGGLEAGTLVGFFTTGCAPCKEQLPLFVEHAARQSGEVIAVVAAPAPDEAMIAQLSPVARVVVELPDGPTVGAFHVSGFPTVLVVGDDGTVAATGNTVDAVRRLAASRA